jgi:phosphoribulokinase
MPRPLLLGIVGDSGTGKTTLTRGLVRILGESQATHIRGDDYLRYDREQRAELGVTPLDPAGNHLDILEQHLLHLRSREAILKPVYSHQDGTFGPSEYVHPNDFTIVESMLGFQTEKMREAFDVRVFLDPPEDLRRRWKVQRDCSRRGYSTDQVLEELDRRESDAERFVSPQRRYADIVVAFTPGDRDDEHLDVRLQLRPGLVHPDLSSVLAERPGAISLEQRDEEMVLWVRGTISTEHSEAIQGAIWERMEFANHLRKERLGEFTIGTSLHRSETLAIAQLLVLYQAVTGRAAIALGGSAARVDRPPAG